MPNGLLNILKSPGMSSHDVVSFVRRLYHTKKVGHAGTLDPAAAGVLPVAVGQATRVLEYMADCDKSYRAEMTLGYETDTGDAVGQVLRRLECAAPSVAELEVIFTSLLGRIEQVPPMYSAIKMNGKKMYELARQGITVERPTRMIDIHALSLIHCNHDKVVFDTTCSKGTYIRTLCSDIGVKLRCPVVMSFLVRTRVGTFTLTDAATLEELTATPLAHLKPLDAALAHLPAITLTTEQAADFAQGKRLRYSCAVQPAIRIYNAEQQFIGIASKLTDTAPLAPVKVMANAD